MDAIEDLATRLVDQARRVDHRRLLVLHGSPKATRQAALRALEAAGIPPEETVLVAESPVDGVSGERVTPDRSKRLLGTTHTALVLDAHPGLDPDVLGRTVGAVDGGGLYLLLAPPLDEWPGTRDGFDETLAVPPFQVDDVDGCFRTRLVDTLRQRPGVAIADAETGSVDREPEPVDPEGPTAEGSTSPIEPPGRASFPDEVYTACRTRDQAQAVEALELLLDPRQVLVVEADRGRGKSSAAGLAAAALLHRGKDVLVTASRPDNAAEVFARAHELAPQIGLEVSETSSDHRLVTGEAELVYKPPTAAIASAGDVDAVVVDEAASLPVHVLSAFLEGSTPLAYATTIHGYEGAGRGFSVRLQDRLDEVERPVHRVEMSQPIRYGEDDPLEAWSFQALLLDAEPPPADELAPTGPDTATYRAPTGPELVDDEPLLREAFGLLVLAHYRTRPSDLARVLDAPNVRLRCLTLDGRVVSVALIAREGGLPADLRARMYEGDRVRGNMLPDVLTSQLRDEAAGEPVGWRVLRIATHPDRRREGFATRLLERVRWEAQAEDGVDWLGTSYGATPGLVSFWGQLGYRSVHVSTRRNEASGEHSVAMLAPLTEAGRELTDRSERWFVDRIGSVLTDALDDLDPDVVRATLATVDQAPDVDLTDRDWRLVAASAFGPGVYDVAPGPFRQLALRHLVEDRVDLDPGAERLLVSKVLQARDWEAIVDELGYPSKRTAMLALAEAFRPIVEVYGGEVAEGEVGRFG